LKSVQINYFSFSFRSDAAVDRMISIRQKVQCLSSAGIGELVASCGRHRKSIPADVDGILSAYPRTSSPGTTS
jgi:hypothetical protein